MLFHCRQPANGEIQDHKPGGWIYKGNFANQAIFGRDNHLSCRGDSRFIEGSSRRRGRLLGPVFSKATTKHNTRTNDQQNSHANQ